MQSVKCDTPGPILILIIKETHKEFMRSSSFVACLLNSLHVHTSELIFFPFFSMRDSIKASVQLFFFSLFAVYPLSRKIIRENIEERKRKKVSAHGQRNPSR